MKFKVSSAILLKELQDIRAAINTNHSFFFPILTYCLFEINKNELKISGSDIDKTVTKVLKVESDGKAMIMLPTKFLIETIGTFRDQPLTIKIVKSKFKIEIISDYGTYKMTGHDGSEFPVFPYDSW